MIEFGHLMGVFNICGAHIAKYYRWKEDEIPGKRSLVMICIPLGASFGAMFSGRLMQFGRRKAFIICDCITIASTTI